MSACEKRCLPYRLGAVRAAAVLAIISTSACHRRKPEEPPSRRIDENNVSIRDVSALSIATITRSKFPESIEVNGKIGIPDKDIVNVTARVQGRLETLTATFGDRVRAGQWLGTIWSSDLITAVEEYRMAKAQNDSGLVSLTESKLRAMGISPQDAVSPQQSSGIFPIRAPISGVVLDKKLNAGSAVNPGDLIAVLGKSGELQFNAEVPPDVAMQIKPGMPVRFPGRSDGLAATVGNVSPVTDPTTNLVRIRCPLSAAAPSGVPQESYVKAEIVVRESEALVAPTQALIATPNGEFVFIRDAADRTRFSRVPVHVLARNSALMSVGESDRLHVGVEVVGDGSILLEGIVEGED